MQRYLVQTVGTVGQMLVPATVIVGDDSSLTYGQVIASAAEYLPALNWNPAKDLTAGGIEIRVTPLPE